MIVCVRKWALHVRIIVPTTELILELYTNNNVNFKIYKPLFNVE